MLVVATCTYPKSWF